MSRVLVTGAAGFIGFHLCKRLLERGDEVVGLDNLNEYYDVSLKINRLRQIARERNFKPVQTAIPLTKTISARTNRAIATMLLPDRGGCGGAGGRGGRGIVLIGNSSIGFY